MPSVTKDTPGNPYRLQVSPETFVKMIGTNWLPAAPLPWPVETCRAEVGHGGGLPGVVLSVGVGAGGAGLGGELVGAGAVTVLVTVGAAAGDPEEPQAEANSAAPPSASAVSKRRGMRWDDLVTVPLLLPAAATAALPRTLRGPCRLRPISPLLIIGCVVPE